MDTKQTRIENSVRELGWGKTIVLGLQHVFAMFGATVLVPILTGFSVSVTLFCAGIATLWFHFITKRRVPVFLGSSFAFLAAYASIANDSRIVELASSKGISPLSYAAGGVLISGLVYAVFALLFKIIGTRKVMRLFPPVVTGPIIILIGLILSPSAVNNLTGSGDPIIIALGIVPILIIIALHIWGKGMAKIIPILIAILVSYVLALIVTLSGLRQVIDFSAFSGKKVVGLPPFALPHFDIGAIITCVVVALAAMIEHIGDMMAIGESTGNNFIENPGLTRTLLGDGVGSSIAGALGGPANTTYGENTGVIVLTGVTDPLVIEIAAVIAILLSMSPILDAAISTVPSCIIGGISFVLYGMISAIGLRTLVEQKVDFTATRNVLVAAVILISGLGFNAYPIKIGPIQFGGLACAALFGIILNAILPGKDYEFKAIDSKRDLI
ncbi:MAG: uracil-xanthine permease family protein [Sphaerochaetaceae bacterium]|nr:uracil-xanthine permease family protein [Spirochaetales bacterium]MDY5967664.1 uracil-xanthine permease family protein [Sphaerochaetaceae bacterium]